MLRDTFAQRNDSISQKLVAHWRPRDPPNTQAQNWGPSEAGNDAGKKKMIALTTGQPGRLWHSKPSAHAPEF
jgi:hypothetical protein